jgi:hypothetical protein
MRTYQWVVAAALVGLLFRVLPAQAANPADTTRVAPYARLIIDADVDSSTVFIDGRTAGTTPLTLDSVASGPHTLLVMNHNPSSWFAKTDSLTIRLDSGATRHLRFSVISPLPFAPAASPGASPLLGELTSQKGRTIGLFASGGLAIAGGITAAYFKISADDRNDAYIKTGNPAFLDERRRLDTAAGIALAATQIGFAVFSYLLLTE